MNNRVVKNVLFQTAYQILNTILPLLTAPYLSRILGANNLGIFSYTSSIVSIFSMFAILGTMNYGTKCIAKYNHDKYEQSKIFWEIYSFQLLVSIAIIVIYIFYLMFICLDNKITSLIQGISIFAVLIDVNWFFFGCEMFRITVLRSFIIRICTVASIFLFVRNINDLNIYVFIMSFGTVISNGILWFKIFKDVTYVKPKWFLIKRHIMPNITLFLPILAMSVYHIMDRTMMGLLSSYVESGYYYNVDKIINIPLGMLYAIPTVMLPRMTSLFHENKALEANNVLDISIEIVILFGSAMTFGISSISPEFITWFFGDGFRPCIELTLVLSPVILIKGLSHLIRMQYFIPLNKEVVYIRCIVYSSVINIIINWVLIPKLGAMGAVIGTLMAEFISCTWQIFIARDFIDIKRIAKSILVYCLFGLIMYISVRISSGFIDVMVKRVFLEALVGIFVYMIFCCIYIRFFNRTIYKKIFNKIY